MRERAPAFRSADHNADSACKPRQRAPADQAGAGEVAARDHSWAIEVSTADGHSWRNGVRLAIASASPDSSLTPRQAITSGPTATTVRSKTSSICRIR